MINLLPPKEKEELLLEKNKKLTIVLGNMVLISLICLTLILFSLKFYILGEITYRKTILNNNERKYQTSDFISLKSLMQKYNSAIIKVNTFYKKEIYFSDALKTISQIQKPKGIYLTSININATKEDNLPSSDASKPLEKGKAKVTVYGTSDTRDNLIIFKDNIEDNSKIKNVYLPPNSWIKSKNVDFYATFEVLTN